MLSRLQPLKLMESATAAMTQRRKRVAILEEEDESSVDEDDNADDDDKDDESVFASPPEEESDEVSDGLQPSTGTEKAVVPNRKNSEDSSAAETLPQAGIDGNMDGADGCIEGSPSGKNSPTTESTKGKKTPTKRFTSNAASNDAPAKQTASEPLTSHAVTPCPKKKNQKTKDTTATPKEAATVTPDTSSPQSVQPATPTPHVVKKRLSVLEHTASQSLMAAQKLVDCTETTWKRHQDDVKRLQKHVKRLQHDLESAQQQLQLATQQTDVAWEEKKMASREYRKLIRRWDKCKTFDQRREQERKEALREAKKRIREVTAMTTEGGKVNKRAKVESSKAGRVSTKKNGRRGGDDDSDDESSDDESSDVVRRIGGHDYNSSSSSDDSDWEGGAAKSRKRTKKAVAATPASIGSKDRSVTRRRLTNNSPRKGDDSLPTPTSGREWQCPSCTLLNSDDLEECDMCGMPRE